MVKYFLILEKKLVKGISIREKRFLAAEAYCYQNSEWVEMDRNEINDRLMGYDPSEDEIYRFGNMEIMDEIREITEEEAEEYIKNNSL